MTMTTDQDPRAWKIAIALAAECELDWARWATGAVRECRRPDCSDASNTDCPGGESTPVAEPWDHDAYRADCARRHVEPGPMPVLRYGEVAVEHGDVKIEACARYTNLRVGPTWADVYTSGELEFGTGMRTREPTPDDLALLARLVAVAAEAMRCEDTATRKVYRWT